VLPGKVFFIGDKSPVKLWNHCTLIVIAVMLNRSTITTEQATAAVQAAVR
jgi:hypothetical protein